MILESIPQREWTEIESDAKMHFYWVIDFYSSGMRVLDIGAGQGHLVRLLRNSAVEAIGIYLRKSNNPHVLSADAKNFFFKTNLLI
ncbi:MAG: methionine biosynthesis protein MetW [Nanoarchaeota archaeon]